jgi:hypothetical protein
VIDVDAAVAIVVLIILFGTLLGIILWTRDAPPYDDGVGGQWADYLPEPLEDEGWAKPPPRTKPPWEQDPPATADDSSREGAASEGARSDGAASEGGSGSGQPGGDTDAAPAGTDASLGTGDAAGREPPRGG